MELKKTPVIFLDLQTTGAKPGDADILEMAWSTLSSEEIQSCLVSLPEGKDIPKRIQMITGIRPAEMTAALSFEEAFEKFLHFVHTHGAEKPVVVIHFAQFEKPFLADAFDKLKIPMPFEILCTHEISKRLFPNLPTRGIKGLAGYFGCPSGEFKRASNHILATQVIWQGLTAALAEKNILHFEALQEWLSQTPKTARTKYEYPLPKEKRLGLPKEPGIYRMMSRWGEVLYVGKATSLHDRVNSYFRGQKNRDSRKLEMLTQVWDLQVTVVGSPLEAALLETDEIKRLDPPYNVSLKTGTREMVFYNHDFTAMSLTSDSEHLLGPFSSSMALDSVIKLSQSLKTGEFLEDLFFETLPANLLQEGFEIFCAQHQLQKENFKSVRSILALGARWYKELLHQEAEDIEEETLEEVVEEDQQEDTEITAEELALRFERHFIRSAATYLRAKKLTRLLNSHVTVHAEIKTELRISGGFLHTDLSSRLPAPWQGLLIDTYDRMTVLHTELNKISAKGYRVEIHPVSREATEIS